MQVKKCMALFASAAFAMLTLAGCGGSDHSELAARTVNAAQGETISVEFTTDRDLTQSLKDALKDTTSAGELIDAIYADEDLTDLLTNGVQVGAYTADSQLSPEEAAQQIAERILTNLSGKQDKGYITMVETEDGAYYAIALFYRTGSGSGNGSGGSSDSGSDDDNTGGGEEGTYTVIVNSNSTDAIISPASGEVKAGDDFSFTVTPGKKQKVVSVKVNGSDEMEPWQGDESGKYTLFNINSNYTIDITFATVSEYGESQYLTQENFTAIGNELGDFATRNSYELGEDPDIQKIVQNFEEAKAKLESKGYTVFPLKSCSGNSVSEVLNNIKNLSKPMFGTYDTVYMGIRDGENGEIECMVYLLKTERTL